MGAGILNPAPLFWPDCGLAQLRADRRGWHPPSDDYLRLLFGRPELAVVEESCARERVLHQALLDDPRRTVGHDDVAALADADVRDSYRAVLRLRELLLAAGTLERAYLRLVTDNSASRVPPALIDMLTRTLVAAVAAKLDPDAYLLRAAELFFRPQQVGLQPGIVLADAELLEQRQPQAMRLLQSLISQADIVAAPADRRAQLLALNHETASDYWHAAVRPGYRASELVLGLNLDEPGLAALCGLLQGWVEHFHMPAVRIVPRREINDSRWRWHLGLDTVSSELLNALYRGEALREDQRRQLLCLFELRAEVWAFPVYLGLAADARFRLRLKPQNLLLNLPPPAGVDDTESG